MILIADSGSTKADWILIEKNKIAGEFHTMGFNPFFHDENHIESELNNFPKLLSVSNAVQEIYFYGAGCSSAARNKIIEKGLQRVFTNADVHVDHDVAASALATCGDEPGIACIIGTGSNSCYYDGKNIHHNNYGLGYVLGDEASGTWFGKKLLTRYLYRTLPAEIHEAFENEHGVLGKDYIIEHVYKKEGANVWLASFAPFISKHRDHPYIIKLVNEGMSTFLDLYVTNYPQYRNLTVHFIGSVAYEFREIIKEIAAHKEIITGKFIRQPIQGLAEYFLSKQIQK